MFIKLSKVYKTKKTKTNKEKIIQIYILHNTLLNYSDIKKG